MHEIIKKISKAVQIVLMAPIKLPGKAMNIIKYVALGLGIIESVLPEDKSKGESGPNSLREDTDTREREQQQHESK
ncbi:hypothetical protein [Sphingobacterium tabacisoli]|uniref:Uncharacterized protein n=1 Tax=Sphingobacterium tabacisoli TaxID=2044855 RepID=A0ABW5L377_9SPHI|nr:hypothetical protein [Sphingobacterium tabacisoli]